MVKPVKRLRPGFDANPTDMKVSGQVRTVIVQAKPIGKAGKRAASMDCSAQFRRVSMKLFELDKKLAAGIYTKVQLRNMTELRDKLRLRAFALAEQVIARDKTLHDKTVSYTTRRDRFYWDNSNTDIKKLNR